MDHFFDELNLHLDPVEETVHSLTTIIKFFFWLGITILVYSAVSHVLFPTEFIMVPRQLWG
jgi:hypothetical protein